MSTILNPALFAAVADAAVRGTVILLAALAATALMRRSSASARHMVWLAALTAVLLLPIARSIVPEWRVLPLPAAATVMPGVESAAPGTRRDLSTATAPGAEPVNAAVPTPAPTMAERLADVDWSRAAVLLWAVGSALVLVRLLAGVARLLWIERRATELTDDEWVRLTDGLSRRLRLGRIVRLLREPAATVPMTWGVFHPVVLLPAESEQWPDERRRVVLAHELAHVRRWDALTQWVAHLALALFWFNPLVWIAVRRLRQEREHACDDAVLEIGTRAADYASHLLDIVRSLGSGPSAAAGLAMARRSQFEGRLLAILDGAVRRNAASRAAALATAAAALACLLPLAALRPAAAATEVAQLPSVPAPASDSVTIVETTTITEQSVDEAGPAAMDEIGERDRLVASARRGDPGQYADIIRAAAGISSATDRRLVLAAVLERPDLSRDNLGAIIQATRTMDSDAERRLVLAAAVRHPVFRASSTVLPAFVDALGWMRAPLEARLVATSAFAARPWSPASQVALLRAVGRTESDTERRIMLTAAAQHQRMDEQARAAYIAAAGGIRSQTERRLALNELTVQRVPAVAANPPRSTPAPRAPEPVTETRRSGGLAQWDGEMHLELSGDSLPRVVRITAEKVFFGAERWDIQRIGAGGRLVVEERVDGQLRRVRAVAGTDGRPAFTYTVDGQSRPFNQASRGWMNALIREFTTS
ncbi:M56 family metallopeptidase [Longimicrobium terrae]|uniref:Beta-lactamase regulating signal transducer with metallopeptidase domain n=1 Tax=Longimicrobium terrae TaxID=1639882 RepID=A0A841GJ24_9BACT|nr:M56 family metallopeptidase [Longimicrobium terrae]MBB4634439.1 beta-lactamase regulating signal transducer with metallopeptidase domain [Longimicrobium terrae]MBB6068671.1 beta-lactamase regulating signal transducer with metallopeptidase domain [Longimicrobium terrae]NNC27857.1 M56 family metallopeptidase [Longimicrobium terrae]